MRTTLILISVLFNLAVNGQGEISTIVIKYNVHSSEKQIEEDFFHLTVNNTPALINSDYTSVISYSASDKNNCITITLNNLSEEKYLFNDKFAISRNTIQIPEWYCINKDTLFVDILSEPEIKELSLLTIKNNFLSEKETRIKILFLPFVNSYISSSNGNYPYTEYLIQYMGDFAKKNAIDIAIQYPDSNFSMGFPLISSDSILSIGKFCNADLVVFGSYMQVGSIDKCSVFDIRYCLVFDNPLKQGANKFGRHVYNNVDPGQIYSGFVAHPVDSVLCLYSAINHSRTGTKINKNEYNKESYRLFSLALKYDESNITLRESRALLGYEIAFSESNFGMDCTNENYLTDFDFLISSDPSNKYYHLFKANLLFFSNDFSNAIKEYRWAFSDKNSLSLIYMSATVPNLEIYLDPSIYYYCQSYAALKMPDSALYYINQALNDSTIDVISGFNKKHSSVYYRAPDQTYKENWDFAVFKTLLLMKTGKPDDAIEYARDIPDFDHYPSVYKAQVYYHISDCFLLKGNVDSALYYLNLSLQNGTINLIYQKGLCPKPFDFYNLYYGNVRYPENIEKLNQFLFVEYINHYLLFKYVWDTYQEPSTLLQFAVILKFMDRPQDAIVVLSEIIDKNPQFHRYEILQRAFQYLKISNYESALTDVNLFIKYEKNSIYVLPIKSWIYYKLGRLDDAKTELENVIANNNYTLYCSFTGFGIDEYSIFYMAMCNQYFEKVLLFHIYWLLKDIKYLSYYDFIEPEFGKQTKYLKSINETIFLKEIIPLVKSEMHQIKKGQ